MSFLSTLEEFGGAWEEVDREKLSKEELKTIKSINIQRRVSKGGNGSTAGESFLCMVFLMKSGKTKSAYLSKRSDLEEGDEVDPKSVEFITLQRDDEEIVKADGAVKE
jgi:hypothetical protein